jgi:hypothetical protein
MNLISCYQKKVVILCNKELKYRNKICKNEAGTIPDINLSLLSIKQKERAFFNDKF